mgnify:CR=1 FL=1
MFGKKNKIIIKVDGMHCEHCAKKVTDAILKVDDSAKVKVDLKSGGVIITSKNSIDINSVKENVNETGFTFVGVKE